MSAISAKTVEQADLDKPTAGTGSRTAEAGRPTGTGFSDERAASRSQTSNARSLHPAAQTQDTTAVTKGTDEQLQMARVKKSDLILFTTQLSVMLDSGVVLTDALNAIANQSPEGVYKNVVLKVAESIETGENFSRALARYPRVFGPMFVSMVRASEASGKMPHMLTVLSNYLNFELDTQKRVKAALTYPFIMALMAVAATGTLMFFVLPRFMRIYEAREAALPRLTRVLVNLSKVLGDLKAMTILLTALVFLFAAVWYFVNTKTGRRVIDLLKIRAPVIKSMFIDMVVARSMRIMATMVNTGVSLLDSILVIQGSCENYYFQQLWARVDGKIRNGYQLSDAIVLCQQDDDSASTSRPNQLIAPGIIQMLRAGEKSGRVGPVCEKISLFYEKKLETSIKNVMAVLEPLMIAILGGIIGTIAIALLLPVFRISSVVAH